MFSVRALYVRTINPILASFCFGWFLLVPHVALAFQAAPSPTRCILIEFYYDASQPEHVTALSELKQHSELKPGMEIVARDLNANDKNQKRLQKLCDHFQFKPDRVPVVYTCNRIIHPLEETTSWKRSLEDAFVLDVYTRAGCARCTAAKKYLEELGKRYPGFRVRYRELTSDMHARSDLENLVHRFRRSATSTPVLHFIDSLVVGFDQESTSGPRIEAILKKWTVECPAHKNPSEIKPVSTSPAQVSEVTDSAPF